MIGLKLDIFINSGTECSIQTLFHIIIPLSMVLFCIFTVDHVILGSIFENRLTLITKNPLKMLTEIKAWQKKTLKSSKAPQNSFENFLKIFNNSPNKSQILPIYNNS